MLRLAILSARGRLGTFTGAVVALTAAAVLAMAWGMQLEGILRAHPPVERYASAAAVISGQQKVGTDHDVFLSERARVSSALTTRLASLAGVRAAIGDVSVPARLGDRATEAHGWASAALTPYVLIAGRPPNAPDEVVAGFSAALGARLPLASTAPARIVTVVGVARPSPPVRTLRPRAAGRGAGGRDLPAVPRARESRAPAQSLAGIPAGRGVLETEAR